MPHRFQVRYTLAVKPAEAQLNPALMHEAPDCASGCRSPRNTASNPTSNLSSPRSTANPTRPSSRPAPPTSTAPAPSAARHTARPTTKPPSPTPPSRRLPTGLRLYHGRALPRLSADNVRELTDDERNAFTHYLAERPPHLVFNDELTALTKQLVGDETNPYLKAKAIFDWWDANIRWCPSSSTARSPALPTFCMQRKRGDCGVQAVTLMSMMRSAGIPARWQSGSPAPPTAKTCTTGPRSTSHRTAGSLPTRPTATQKRRPPCPQLLLRPMDIYRIIVNLDYGQQLAPPKQSLRSEPADFQRGEGRGRRREPVL